MSAPAKEQSNLIILKNDINFRLREDGDFQCNEHISPDFSTQETKDSFIRMMEYVKEAKKATPEKEIFLHYHDEAKIELNEYITPSAVINSINEIRPIATNRNYRTLVESQKHNNAKAATFADSLVENEMYPNSKGATR